MQRRSSAPISAGLIALTIATAALVGYLIVWFASGAGQASRQQAVLGVSDEDVTPTQRAMRTPTPRGTPRPTPTFVVGGSPTAQPDEAVAALPAPTPTPEAAVVPTDIPPSPAPPFVPAPTEAPPSVPIVGSSVRLEETAWRGGWRQSKPYGGRVATWIYGTGTDYSSMRAAFVVDELTNGAASLTIEGMDSEDRAKTPILIAINGAEIYRGPNPLPNDDQPLDSGTWASYTWRFDANVVQPGTNTITISTLTPGQFRQPPFFMLDYAVISLPSRTTSAVSPPAPTIAPTDLPTAQPTDSPPTEAPTPAPTEAMPPTNPPVEPTTGPTEEPTAGSPAEPTPTP